MADPTNKTGQDPIVEPPNSTVDDWMGQRVGRDEERAEEALRETGGDADEAEERFEERSERHAGEPEGDDPDTPAAAAGAGYGESDIPDPMPEELRNVPDQTDHVDEMGGESPTG